MMHKNKYFLLHLLGLFITWNTYAQWIPEKCPTTSNLNSINLFNENSGWIVGDNGTMLYKASNCWIDCQKITDENLYSVFLIDESDGWVVGSKGVIFRFNGRKWEKFPSPTRFNLYSVSFSDAQHGIAVGANGTIIVYENGIWELVEKNTEGDFYTVSAKSDLSMIGGGRENLSIPLMTMPGNSEKCLVKSFDPGFIEIRSLAIPDEKNVWAVGRPGTIFHFNGRSWTRIEQFEKLPSLKSVYFSDKNNGIAVGYSGSILTFNGNEWKKEVSSVNVKLNGAFISENKYYAVGNNGTIVSWKHVLGNESDPIIKNNTVIKIKTYPNPSTDILNIIIPDEEGFIADRIYISNVYGQVVFNKRIDPGTGNQVYQINTSELNNGLYLVNITSSGKKEASGKVMVKH